MERGYAKHEIAIPKDQIHHIHDGDILVGMIHPHWFQRRPDCAGTWVGAVKRPQDDSNGWGPILDTDGNRDRKFATAEEAEASVRDWYAYYQAWEEWWGQGRRGEAPVPPWAV